MSEKQVIGSPIVILQLDPGVKEFALYTLTLEDGSNFGMVLVAKTSDGNYEPNTEYWSLTQAGLNGLPESDKLIWNGSYYDWADLPDTDWPGSDPLPMFTMPAQVTWRGVDPPTNVFATNATSNNVTLDFALTYDDNDGWKGELSWAQTAEAEFVISNGETTMTMTATPARARWAGATVVPTAVT